jgi:hypothetical protein
METKKFVQTGIFSVAVALPLLILFVILTFTTGLEDTSLLIIFSMLSLIMLFLLLFFYQIVIEIDQTYISFKMGIGLFHKKYRIDNLDDCQPIVNSFITGIGIRPVSKGWLYNVSGYSAIELTFKDSEKVVRIGTNKPDEIAEIVSGFLNKKIEPIDHPALKRRNTRTRDQYLLVGAVLLIIFLFTLYGNHDAKITVQQDHFVISGIYGGPINYADIIQLDTVTRMPAIQMRTNGYGFGKICKGNFKLKEEGNARLFVDCGASPFIRLQLKSEKVCYINFKNRQKTIDLFKKLKEKIK